MEMSEPNKLIELLTILPTKCTLQNIVVSIYLKKDKWILN